MRSYIKFESGDEGWGGRWSPKEVCEEVKLVRCVNIDSYFSERECLSLKQFCRWAESGDFTRYIFKELALKGCIDLESPLGGRVVSSVSILFGKEVAIRFSGREVFYLLQGNFTCDAIFFPFRNILVSLSHCTRPEKRLFSLLSKINRKAEFYFERFKNPAPFCTHLKLLVSHPSPFHYYYFKIPAFLSCLPDSLEDSFVAVSFEDGGFFDLSRYVKGVDWNSSKVSGLGPSETFSGDFFLSVGQRLSETSPSVSEFADKLLVDYSRNVIDADFRGRVESVCRDGDFVVWLGSMTGKRSWIEELGFYKNFIEALSVCFGKVVIFFDGWTSPVNPGEKAKKVVEVYSDDEINYNEVVNFSESLGNVEVLSLIGCSADEKVFSALMADFFITSHATASMWVSRVAKKPGVTHISNAARKSAIRQHIHHDADIVPNDMVKDVGFNEADVFQVSYSIDESFMMEFVINKMQKLGWSL